MNTPTSISNLAISHIGQGKSVSNIDTEKSVEANACKIYYPLALDFMLRTYRIPAFIRNVSLAMVSTNPSMDWRYAFRLPNDCARVWRINSGYKVDTEETKIPFTMSSDDSGMLLLADIETASIEYSINNPNPRFFTSDFVMALSYKLAEMIAPLLTSGDVFKITERMERRFATYSSRLMATTQNEGVSPEIKTSGFARSR